jgi:hypothetical protein
MAKHIHKEEYLVLARRHPQVRPGHLGCDASQGEGKSRPLHATDAMLAAALPMPIAYVAMTGVASGEINHA